LTFLKHIIILKNHKNAIEIKSSILASKCNGKKKLFFSKFKNKSKIFGKMKK
jgi:hypothetical protein